VAMVQVAVTRDLAEAEEIQTILQSAGIPSELQPAVDHHPTELDDMPTKVLVPAESLEAAQDAVEALTDPETGVGGV
jgi:uroporphyrinogen-III synthase